MTTESLHRRQGAAFLYMMLIFIAASVIIGGLLNSQYLELDRTKRFLDEEQAMQYALGAETYARQMLYDDMTHHGPADYVGEAWSGKQSPFAIPGGIVEIDIDDLRGRFNINSLLGSDPAAVDYFKALCKKLDITEDSVNTVMAQLQNLKPQPPVPGSSPLPPLWMVDTSELVDHGMFTKDYFTLAPYITALPSDSYAVNINTASDAVLFAFLADARKVDAVHDAIKKDGHIGDDQLSQLQNGNLNLKISSDAFHVRITVRMEDHELHLSSTLLRVSENGQRVLTIARKWGQ